MNRMNSIRPTMFADLQNEFNPLQSVTNMTVLVSNFANKNKNVKSTGIESSMKLLLAVSL